MQKTEFIVRQAKVRADGRQKYKIRNKPPLYQAKSRVNTFNTQALENGDESLNIRFYSSQRQYSTESIVAENRIDGVKDDLIAAAGCGY